MSGRRKSACNKCTAQKLRCSGERPSCQRCSRLRRPCVYSAGAVNLKAKANIPASVPEQTHSGIPSVLLGPLIDTFFAHVYNASLLLYRPTLNAALKRDAVPPAILLGVCAFAAKFHRDQNGALALVDNGVCRDWAERGGRLAFEEAQFPRDDNVTALINLALFWYSEGEFQRAALYECCATKTAVILGFLMERRSKENALESEIRRRKFWACFLISSHQSRSTLPSPPSEEILHLSLPCREEDYEVGVVRDSVTLNSDRCNGSVYAQFVRGTFMWNSVYELIKKSEQNWSTRLALIQTLDGKIQDWWSKMTPSLKANPSDGAHLTLHIVYHLCLCVLHASIVPLLSWSTIDEAIPSYTRKLSAQTAFEHANSISSILESTSVPPSRIPGLVGYAVYVACAIQVPFLRCLDTAIRQQARSYVSTNFSVIKSLGVHWKFIELLGRNMRWFLNFYAKHPLELPSDPLRMDPSFLSGHQLQVKRVRLSILTHNQVIIGEEGAVAQGPEDVEDFGAKVATDTMDNVPSIADFDLNDQGINFLDPMAIAMFPSFSDPFTFGSEFPPSITDDMSVVNSDWRFEDWMDEFFNAGSS